MEQLRLKALVRGAVQGVGFRPFIFRLAGELGLAGWVRNTGVGVEVEVEGPAGAVRAFVPRLESEKPARAILQGLEHVYLDPVGYAGFTIRASLAEGGRSALILPDVATCADCLRELFDPADRRYRYPFINCTNCGPRFSIIEALPYDRANTSMKAFRLCPDCRAEYENPRDRRFHAQPLACPRCGPQATLWDAQGKALRTGEEAVADAAGILRGGAILALKGLGGFQLLVDARDEVALRRLRQRKHREEKPFAVMCPTLADVRGRCHVSEIEARLLRSCEAPIVLLRRCGDGLARAVAPGNPALGVMLPYTPLHHLLLRELAFPLVATSGNVSDEPICIDEHEALQRLDGIADYYLVHNRPIVRHLDDSVVRVQMDRELVLRRARGYAPLPVGALEDSPVVLAVGAHLKNTVGLSAGGSLFLSQHIGDLATSRAQEAFRKVAGDLPALYGVAPAWVACDAHPDYLSTRFAQDGGLPVIAVQHHYAHVLACLLENQIEGPALGVAWDGTGYGSDGTIWGGEFMRITASGFERIAHLRRFRLPGGEAAIREPWRCALGVRFAIGGEAAFGPEHPPAFRQMLRGGVNSPLTSSAGRLFDAVAALLGLCRRTSFEGQAAMELEHALAPGVEDAYPIGASAVIDWEPTIEALLDDDSSVGVRAARFHNALVEAIVGVACLAGEARVVLTGGCFQNRYLTERAVGRLREAGFRPYWHQRVPPNDGGIAIGQLAAAVRTIRMSRGASDQREMSAQAEGLHR